MNNSTQAQKGFKTFLLTLSISLIVFSVIYYFVTNNSSSTVSLDADVESNSQNAAPSTKDTASNNENSVVGPAVPSENMNGPKLPAKNGNVAEEKPTLFGQIAAANPKSEPRAVLAATTSVSQTSVSGTGAAVPDGGTTSITLGLIMSLFAFLGGMFVIYKDPRKMAIQAFERDVVNRLK